MTAADTPTEAPTDEPTDTPTEAPTTGDRRRSGGWGIIGLTVALALVWPALWAMTWGSPDAVLAVGDDGLDRPFIQAEIPDVAMIDGMGHDGQAFYVIARHPFDPEAAQAWLDLPSYRYRRILFPLLGATLAPDGGRGLIVAFGAISLVGVAIGARALQRLGGNVPRWFPLVMAANPAVVTSLTLSLSDALGSGLALAAIVASARRRWAAAVGLAILAALTREVFLIAALAIAFTPAMPRRWRVASAVAPAAALGAWCAFVATRLDDPSLNGASAQFGLPLTGLFSPRTDAQTYVMTLLSAVLLTYGAWVTPRALRQVRLMLVFQAVLLISISSFVASNYINSIRTAAPLLPLAAWAVLSHARDRAAALEEADEADQADQAEGGAPVGPRSGAEVRLTG